MVAADGDITGDYTQGIIDAMMAVARQLIDPSLSPDDDAVNIIAKRILPTTPSITTASFGSCWRRWTFASTAGSSATAQRRSWLASCVAD